MYRFLVCANSKCCFVLDRRMCPSCGETLAVKSVAGQSRRVCCSNKSRSNAVVAEPSLAMAAQFSA
jgi:hypothetical protein